MPLRVHAQLAAFQNVATGFLRWGAVLGRGPAQQDLDAFAMPTIALVDDDRNILTSVSIALEAEGYRINT
jgi:hypothetical protein